MPTVVRLGSLVVKVYGPPREHPPPHVHIEVGRTGVVVLRLPLGDKPLEVWRVHGEVGERDVIAAVQLVEAHEPAIRVAWERIHAL